ncbi:hypothetical protein KL936_000933 [Ogataea polymorpha]|nr:hypothetical protein KL936_000933 [Ogataea polymorpha]
MGSFDLISSFEVEYAPVNVKKWKSNRTGLEVCLIAKESPSVSGWFALATEIFDDSGCPHTLEHLIFMGSKRYPYKGLLDILGNLAFSTTNAWTATDQTVYTLMTAGWEGFKMILPAYLDHILHPTLTDEACYTEVYHIDGKGREKGVVYSEMQGIQFEPSFVALLEKQRTLYTKSAYRSETGGLVENLRTLTSDEIRQFHKEHYRPDNLCLIITGMVDENELLDILEKFDAEITPLPETPNKRPFVDSVQDDSLSSSITKTVYFGDEDESKGDLTLTFIGPNGVDLLECLAVETLSKYLTDSSVSLFRQAFVEVENPLATHVSTYNDDYIKTIINIDFSNISIEDIDEMPKKITKVLADHETELDITRIRDVVDQSKWDLIYEAENDDDTFVTSVIYQFIYGDKSSNDLPGYLKDLKDYEILMAWEPAKWRSLYTKYFVSNPSLFIIAKPSKELYRSNRKAGKQLLKDRKAKLGAEGLKKLATKLEIAIERNNTPIPDEILESFGYPDVAKIKFIQTQSIAAGKNHDVANDVSLAVTRKVENDTPDGFPLYLHFENIKSNFVTVDLLCSSFEVHEKLLNYIHVFAGLFTLPLEQDGKLIPYSEVVKDVQRDTISATVSTSFDNNFQEFVDFKIVARSENYGKVIDWYTKLLFHTKFTQDRVKVAVEKALNNLPSKKRSGYSMLNTLMNKHIRTQRSLARAQKTYLVEAFLKDLLKKIDDDFDTVARNLEQFRQQLIKQNNIRVLVVADVARLEHPVASWETFAANLKFMSEPLTDLPYTAKVLTDVGKLERCGNCYIISTPGSSASYMDLMAKIPLDANARESAKILLAAEVLQCVEGPFWRGIRGSGLAYGANVYRIVEWGTVIYDIYRGVDVEKCFEVGKEIVESYASEVQKISDKALHGAMSSVVNSLVNGQTNYVSAAYRKFFDQILMKRGPDYNQTLVKSLSQVTSQDVVDVLKKYFLPMFDPKSSVCFVCCSPSKVESIEKFFNSKGYATSVEYVAADDAEESYESDEDEDGDEDEDDYSDTEDDGDDSDEREDETDSGSD